jgi:glycosyltransferase involved in cell wall biosynthesis
MSQVTPYLSLVIPAYNEARRITETLLSVYEYLVRQPFSWEIVVVLDGPQDDTLQCVQEFARGRKSIRWINRVENRGKGYTVREGLLSAQGQIRLFSDADNSTDISHFDQMKPLFDKGSQVVICSRDAKDVPGAGQAVPQPFVKRVLGDAGNLFVQLLAVPGIWDTQCGFKAFSATAAETIFSAARIDGWGFDIEALALARHFGYDVEIIPARWIDHVETHVRFWNYFTTLWETIQVRWNLWTGAYDRLKGRAVAS